MTHITTDLTDYRDHLLERGMRPNTIEQRTSFAQRFAATWGTWNVPGARIADWLSKFDGWTAVTYYANLRSVLDWALRSGRIDRDPMGDMRRPATPRSRAHNLTADQVDEVLDASIDTPLYAYLILGLRAGLRSHEIAKFCGSDLREDQIVVDGKNGTVDYLPAHPDIVDVANAYPRRGHWFPSPSAHRDHITYHSVTVPISRLFDRFDIGGSIHRTRHTFGTNLVDNGVDMRTVQTLMRHASLATTQLYLGQNQALRVAAIHSLGGGRR